MAARDNDDDDDGDAGRSENDRSNESLQAPGKDYALPRTQTRISSLRGKKRRPLSGTVYPVYRYAKNDGGHYPTKTQQNFHPNEIPAPIILKKLLLKILAGDFETSRGDRTRGRGAGRVSISLLFTKTDVMQINGFSMNGARAEKCIHRESMRRGGHTQTGGKPSHRCHTNPRVVRVYVYACAGYAAVHIQSVSEPPLYILVYELFELFTVELHLEEMRDLFVGACREAQERTKFPRVQMFAVQFLYISYTFVTALQRSYNRKKKGLFILLGIVAIFGDDPISLFPRSER